MGVSSSPAELAGKLGRLSRELDNNQRNSVNSAARLVGDVMYQEGSKSIGGNLIAGRKWGTYVKPAKSNTRPEALAAYKGPVHWFDRGTKAHLIVSRKAGGTRKSRGALSPGPGMFKGRRGRGAVTTPAGYRAYARHPGTNARPFWSKAKTRAQPVAVAEMRTGMVERPLKRIF